MSTDTTESRSALAVFPFRIRSREADAIIALVKAMQPDEIMLYATAKEQLRFSLQDSVGYARLQTARRALRREGIELAVEPSVGIRRLTSSGIAKSLDKDLRHVSRATHRVIQKGKNVKLAELPPPERSEYIARISQAAAIHHVSSARITKRLITAAQTSEDRLPLAKTLALFQDGKAE